MNPLSNRALFAVPLVVTAVTCIALLFSCSSYQEFQSQSGVPAIRVCLEDQHTSARIFFEKDAFLIGAPNKVSIKADAVYECRMDKGDRITITSGGEMIAAFNGTFRAWYPNPKQRFGFEGNRYSDTLEVSAIGDQLIVLNVLPLDRYLESVVPNEIGRNLDDKAYAAAEAQAIISRTYAMSRIDLPVKKLFHVYDDTRDQVFTGMMKRTRLTSRATRETAGLVLMDNQRYVEAYFHGVCGGHTEAVENAWPGHEQLLYLEGVSDAGRNGDYCRHANQYRWTETYTRQDLEALLADHLASASPEGLDGALDSRGHLLDIKIAKRTASKRVSALHIFWGTSGKYTDIAVRGDKIRRALRRPGTDKILRSTLFDIALARDNKNWITDITINGGGNGHGVGMCQAGAIMRAHDGANAERILQAYYPGTSIARLYSGS